MLRSIYFYLAISCGAFALANIVWASPPDTRAKSVRSGGAVAGKNPVNPVAPKDVKILPKKTIDTPRVHDKIKTPDAAKKIDVKPLAPKVAAKPQIVAPKVNPIAPAVKHPLNNKIDMKELAKIKPHVDLTKINKTKLISMKPPGDFKVKPISLAKIQVPANAMKVGQLNAKAKLGGASFVLNQNYFKGSNYHLQHGVKSGSTWYYPGWNHHHWHHSIWDPAFGCYYYYDPCLSCYYYWSPSANCYYPCWWFVEYRGTSYPWWLCGGFERYGYQARPQNGIAIRFGW